MNRVVPIIVPDCLTLACLGFVLGAVACARSSPR
jgi:hypothetical protein